jgi:hypothetical protein
MEPGPTKQKPTDPQTLKDIEHVEEHGYIILENVFSVTKAEEAKAEINRLRTKDLSGPSAGRNEFEGFQTERIYGLLDKYILLLLLRSNPHSHSRNSHSR